MQLKIQRLDKSLPLPQYQTAGAAGLDLCAAITEPVILKRNSISLVPTGIAIALEPGFEAQVRSRSGLSLKHGIIVLNAPGTIDSDYRGEIALILMNLGAEDFTITRGMRMAQLVVSRCEQAELLEVETLEDDSHRGKQGFGSTGI